MTNNMVFNLYNKLGDNMKKTLILSILLGVIFSLILYLNYKKNTEIKNNNNILYFLQVAAYKDLNNVNKEINNLQSYIVIEEIDNLYHIYVGITLDQKNFEKVKEFYKKNDYNIYVREKVVNCKNFISDLKNYDILLSKSNSKNSVDKIEKEVLKKYKEYNCENIRNG